MDRDSKIKKLLDMQEHPEQYSEQELEQMLRDTEAQELMEATAQLKQAMTWERLQAGTSSGMGDQRSEVHTSKETTDVDSEWQQFAKTHFVQSKPKRNWLQVAAMFIGILFVTGFTFAAIHLWNHIPRFSPKSEGDETALVEDTVERATSPLPAEEEPVAELIVFDNVSLDSIAKAIAAYHHLPMEIENDEARQLRFFFEWNQKDSLQEVVEKLNMFEHVTMAVENGKLMVR